MTATRAPVRVDGAGRDIDRLTGPPWPRPSSGRPVALHVTVLCRALHRRVTVTAHGVHCPRAVCSALLSWRVTESSEAVLRAVTVCGLRACCAAAVGRAEGPRGLAEGGVRETGRHDERQVGLTHDGEMAGLAAHRLVGPTMSPCGAPDSSDVTLCVSLWPPLAQAQGPRRPSCDAEHRRCCCHSLPPVPCHRLVTVCSGSVQ